MRLWRKDKVNHQQSNNGRSVGVFAPLNTEQTQAVVIFIYKITILREEEYGPIKARRKARTKDGEKKTKRIEERQKRKEPRKKKKIESGKKENNNEDLCWFARSNQRKKKQEKITKQKGNREKHRELEKIHKAKE